MLVSLRKKCPYSNFFWSIFSRIRTECGDLRRKSPYSVRMQENMDQKTPNTDTFRAVYVVINLFNPNVLIVQKPINWFAIQIGWLILHVAENQP